MRRDQYIKLGAYPGLLDAGRDTLKIKWGKCMKILRRILAKANQLEEAVVIAVFVVMLAASFAQVLNRNLFQAPIGWFEELARYAQVYVALLAMELGLRDGSQMSLTAVTDRLPGQSKELVSILAKIIVAGVSILFFVKSIQLFQGMVASEQRSPGLKIYMYIPYFALPLSFGIASAVQSCTVIQKIVDLCAGHHKKEVSH